MLMPEGAAHRRPDIPVAELKFQFSQPVDGKTLRKYLSDEPVHGDSRRQVILCLDCVRSYAARLLTDHAAFLRSAGKLIGARYVGVCIVEDGVSDNPLGRDEEFLAEYFCAHCIAVLGVASETDADARRALPPYAEAQRESQRQGWLTCRASGRRCWLRRCGASEPARLGACYRCGGSIGLVLDRLGL